MEYITGQSTDRSGSRDLWYWRGSSRARQRLSLALAWALLILGLGLLGLRLAGYQYIYTRGDSMEPTFSAGSLLLTRPAAPEDIQAGDIIAFPGASEGIPNVVHRVLALQTEGQRIVALTMGDNNPVPDLAPLTLDRPVARVVLMIPYAGWWMTPALGWHLLGVGALLGLRTTLSWGAQRKKESGTKALCPVVPTVAVAGRWASVPLERLTVSLPGALRGDERGERRCLGTGPTRPFARGKSIGAQG